MSDMGSEIASFYRGKSVFITGASGFIGKVLLEKILRSCPGVSTVYILIRPKRGNDVKTRMEELLNAKLFDLVRREHPAQLQKVVPIIGDITSPDLGINASDVAVLQENVAVVFHAAATVRFDEPLKQAAILNIIGTRSIVELSRKMTKLAALIHVSTAYCNCNQKQGEEILYPAPADPEKFIEWLQWMDDEVLTQITPKIIGARPNTYTYTKALAEHLFNDMASDLPAAIVRPSIVSASWKEPVAGWVDSLNGPTGLIAGTGKGLIRSLLCDKDMVCDMIPVDILCNLMITVGWRTATTRSNNMMVYNCTSSTVNPIKWDEFQRVLGVVMKKNPFQELFWYPGGSLTTSKFYHKYLVAFHHMLPAHVLDTCAFLLGKKPYFVKLQEKMWRAIRPLEYFTTQEWAFNSKNTTHLLTQLSDTDRELFNFDVSQVRWNDYLVTYFEGIKKFILKESENNANNARKIYFLHRVTQIVTFIVILKMARVGTPFLKRVFYNMLNVTLHTAKFLTIKG